MSHPTSTRAAWIGLAILTVTWGLSWSVMKGAMHYSGPFSFVALRFAIATVALFAVLLLQRKSLRPPPLLPTLGIALFQTTGFQALAQWALVSGGVGRTSLLAYTMPFWVVPLAWWWLHEKPGLRGWACIALAALGYICVIEPWNPLGAPLSIAFALIAGLGWACATVLTKHLFQQHPDLTPLRLTAWQVLFGTLGLVILALASHERAIDWSAAYIGALLYTGLLSSGLGWLLWAVVVERLPANVAGVAILAVPVTGVLFAWGLLAERPSIPEGIGIVVIAVALVALRFRGDVSA